MLFESSLTPSQAKGERPDWLAGSLTGLRGLLRFLAVLGLLFGVAYLYFEQVNSISGIRNDTVELQQQSVVLERENVSLMVQVAAWNRPDYVRSKALEQGFVPLSQPAYVQVPPAEQTTAQTHQLGDLATWWQQLVSNLADRWPMRGAGLAAEQTGP